MPSVIIAGGGLAGLAAAVALGSAGYEVTLFESRPFLGGRATSYPVPAADGPAEIIDNCQHVLLRCCVNLLDFYSRLNVQTAIEFHRAFNFVEPGGRVSTLRAGLLPHPLHLAESFLKLSYLNIREKLALAKALLALKREYRTRTDLDQITMLSWLREKKQPERVISRFWNQVLVSAINEDLDRMAAIHGFQVMWLGFLADSRSYEMGTPAVPLGELYGSRAWDSLKNVRLCLRSPVEEFGTDGVRSGGKLFRADTYLSALPFERLRALSPDLTGDLSLDHSPITGIHLWFDRPITELPHATLLDRTIQWVFNKADGRYVQLVVSASRSLVPLTKQEVVALALSELGEFLPAVRGATLEKSHVVKEVRATFSAAPGLQQLRPGSNTVHKNVFLAGDWTRSGWPATMEGAVRSGYLAAEAIGRAQGQTLQFLLPDIA